VFSGCLGFRDERKTGAAAAEMLGLVLTGKLAYGGLWWGGFLWDDLCSFQSLQLPLLLSDLSRTERPPEIVHGHSIKILVSERSDEGRNRRCSGCKYGRSGERRAVVRWTKILHVWIATSGELNRRTLVDKPCRLIAAIDIWEVWFMEIRGRGGRSGVWTL